MCGHNYVKVLSEAQQQKSSLALLIYSSLCYVLFAATNMIIKVMVFGRLKLKVITFAVQIDSEGGTLKPLPFLFCKFDLIIFLVSLSIHLN